MCSHHAGRAQHLPNFMIDEARCYNLGMCGKQRSNNHTDPCDNSIGFCREEAASFRL